MSTGKLGIKKLATEETLKSIEEKTTGTQSTTIVNGSGEEVEFSTSTNQTDGSQKSQVVDAQGANIPLATSIKQSDGSQKTQVVDSDGDNIPIATSTKQSDGSQKTQVVDASNIAAESIIRTFAYTLTRPANQTPYDANDVIMDVGAAMPEFANVAKANGYGVAILNIRAQTNDTGLAGKTLRVNFYNSALSSVPADNSAFSLADENAEKREGSIELTFGSGAWSKVAMETTTRLAINPAARSVFILPVVTGAYTPSANSTWIKFYIKCLLTN